MLLVQQPLGAGARCLCIPPCHTITPAQCSMLHGNLLIGLHLLPPACRPTAHSCSWHTLPVQHRPPQKYSIPQRHTTRLNRPSEFIHHRRAALQQCCRQPSSNRSQQPAIVLTAPQSKPPIAAPAAARPFPHLAACCSHRHSQKPPMLLLLPGLRRAACASPLCRPAARRTASSTSRARATSQRRVMAHAQIRNRN